MGLPRAESAPIPEVTRQMVLNFSVEEPQSMCFVDKTAGTGKSLMLEFVVNCLLMQT